MATCRFCMSDISAWASVCPRCTSKLSGSASSSSGDDAAGALVLIVLFCAFGIHSCWTHFF